MGFFRTQQERFAVRLLGSFDESAGLKRRFVEILKQDLDEVRGAGLRQARQTVARMESLKKQNLLPVELAETFAEWVAELDPEDLAARHILAAVRRDERQRQAAQGAGAADSKKQEAVASIEKLLADGNPATAKEALDFAVRLFGEFEQIPHLQRRISRALRQQS